MKMPMILPTIALTLTAVFACAQEVEPMPVWHKDWAAAQRIARNADKPIFAIFVCQH